MAEPSVRAVIIASLAVVVVGGCSIHTTGEHHKKDIPLVLSLNMSQSDIERRWAQVYASRPESTTFVRSKERYAAIGPNPKGETLLAKIEVGGRVTELRILSVLPSAVWTRTGTGQFGVLDIDPAPADAVIYRSGRIAPRSTFDPISIYATGCYYLGSFYEVLAEPINGRYLIVERLGDSNESISGRFTCGRFFMVSAPYSRITVCNAGMVGS